MNFLILLSFLFLIHKLYDTDNLIETDRSRRLRESTSASINSVRSLDKFKHSRKLEFVANLLKINLLFLIIKIVAHNFETFDRKNCKIETVTRIDEDTRETDYYCMYTPVKTTIDSSKPEKIVFPPKS